MSNSEILLQQRIEKERQKLERMMGEDRDWDEIYEQSLKLDLLIEEYFG
ncbi:MAG: Spo0E family sporulation regulatory protein-aspartic acid phosphatase [Lachnospiraceae bacterium]|nr:Spo0E family sporulation regulatory protein-aspartic acid phosphatase [Robinsoniella sp.]MDY3767220.1 Spo0E family sporulation regulatory protein-aspartic acid phosphatase [Lachnospiraceae bacterium]